MAIAGRPQRAEPGPRAVVVFALIVGLGGIVLQSRAMQDGPLLHATALVSRAASAGLNLLGFATSAGPYGITGARDLAIANECNGLWAHLIVTAAIVAFPATRLRRTIAGLVLAQIVLFAANLLRIIVLYVVAVRRPALFRDAHVYGGQFFIVAVAVVLFAAWYEWERRACDTGSAAPHA